MTRSILIGVLLSATPALAEGPFQLLPEPPLLASDERGAGERGAGLYPQATSSLPLTASGLSLKSGTLGGTELTLVGRDQAPTTPELAVGASLGTLFVGFGTGLGSLQPYARTQDPQALRTPVVLAGLSTAILLMGLGPNVGDLLNGDAVRFITRGGLRSVLGLACAAVVLLSSSPLGTLVAVLAGTGLASWAAVDIYATAQAPARWAERENRARGVTFRF
ncbi:MAG: hypothetical protein ACT4TC_02225 [Myxococcaceae bacterium]